MTKKQIIELLDKEVGLFEETEDEDSLGELYLSELQFKDVNDLLKELISQKKAVQKWENELNKRIINGNERFTVLTEIMVKDKIINIPEPLIVIGGALINNYFEIKNKKGLRNG